MSATPRKPRCTPEQRAAISRANGARSHGPVTPEGLSASRRARLSHGCRAQVVIPDHEAPDALDAAYQEWEDYVHPRSPAARMLVGFCAEADVLRQRAAELGSPIQMCDALSRNTPKLSNGVQILLANCLAHGRRQFVEIAPNFPAECRYVLESLGSVYHNDAEAREHNLPPEERLRFHQEHSVPVMKQLHMWLEAQINEKKVEPNSGLGKAITYLRRHWKGLTAFLRQAGAPLDNNICEQALKRAVLHRRNGLFYKTLHGAEVGDVFMSLIHSCQLGA
jgi:hypothetical protein